jgi:hypothetical protein
MTLTDRFGMLKGLTLEKAVWILFWAFALGVVAWQLLTSVHL